MDTDFPELVQTIFTRYWLRPSPPRERARLTWSHHQVIARHQSFISLILLIEGVQEEQLDFSDLPPKRIDLLRAPSWTLRGESKAGMEDVLRRIRCRVVEQGAYCYGIKWVRIGDTLILHELWPESKS